MPQIIPIKELKDTANVSELCHTLNEPIFITKNGYGDMVLMSMDYYETTRKKWEMYADLEISEEQIMQGKTRDARKALQSVRAKYGL
ncbi:MAG: type II toxin-antitoxin system Phd/YefM family antitoxin [Clostridia bacterium]|nr:type II toxin-antitoxin system Phd/YefM family antitoxin [Clostridia bacterium]